MPTAASSGTMRIRLGALRALVRESYMNGVPEWQLRQDTEDFVDQIRDRIRSYVLVNRSGTAIERQEAFVAMDDVCDDLEAEVYDLLDDKLFSFMRRV